MDPDSNEKFNDVLMIIIDEHAYNELINNEYKNIFISTSIQSYDSWYNKYSMRRRMWLIRRANCLVIRLMIKWYVY